MSGFAIQFNKNSFGLTPAKPLAVPSPVAPGVTISSSLPLVTTGPVMRMDPLLKIQMAMKNDIDVFYFELVHFIHKQLGFSLHFVNLVIIICAEQGKSINIFPTN